MNVQASNHHWFVVGTLVLLLVAMQDLHSVMSYSSQHFGPFGGLTRFTKLMSNRTYGSLSGNISSLGALPKASELVCDLSISFFSELCVIEADVETSSISNENERICKFNFIVASCVVSIACITCTEEDTTTVINYLKDDLAKCGKWEKDQSCTKIESLGECVHKIGAAVEAQQTPNCSKYYFEFTDLLDKDKDDICKKVDKLIDCDVKPFCKLCDKEASEAIFRFIQSVLTAVKSELPCDNATLKCPMAVWIWVLIAIGIILVVIAIVALIVLKPFSRQDDSVYPVANGAGSDNTDAAWNAAPTTSAAYDGGYGGGYGGQDPYGAAYGQQPYGGQPIVYEEDGPKDGEEADQEEAPPPPDYRSKIKYASSAGEAWPKQRSSAGSVAKQPRSSLGAKGGRPQSKAKMMKRASGKVRSAAASKERAGSGGMKKAHSRAKSSDYLTCKSRVGSTGKMKVNSKARHVSKASSAGKLKKTKGGKGHQHKGSHATPKSRTY